MISLVQGMKLHDSRHNYMTRRIKIWEKYPLTKNKLHIMTCKWEPSVKTTHQTCMVYSTSTMIKNVFRPCGRENTVIKLNFKQLFLIYPTFYIKDSFHLILAAIDRMYEDDFI